MANQLSAVEILSQYSGKFVRIELTDGRKLQGRFFGTGPAVAPTPGIPHTNCLIFSLIDDIEAYKNDVLNYKAKNEYFSPFHIRNIAQIG